jgi:prepilin-type N-terminal cleavage/methylation domain-containing protein
MTQRKGFSLIEVMVAMTILSIVMMSLAKIGVSIAVKGRTNDLVAKRNAALQLEANKLNTVPFGSLGTWSTTTKSFKLGDFSYTRRTTISAMSMYRYSVKVVVIPSLDDKKKDSVMFDRTNPPANTVLCTTCTPVIP